MMIKTISKKGIVIGEGKPKICVPITGKTLTEIKIQAEEIQGLENEMVEWRVDCFSDIKDEVKIQETLQYLKNTLHNKLILFTFRSKREGGTQEISNEEYFKLCKNAIRSQMIDFVDVELFTGDELVSELVKTAHENEVYVIMSNHDFDKTPAKEVIIERLMRMQQLGADILKMAVMPKTAEDVLTLLSATNKMNTELAEKPVVTMSMAKLGVISRLAGEVFGSAITFGTAGEASAPGQIPVKPLSEILNLFHE